MLKVKNDQFENIIVSKENELIDKLIKEVYSKIPESKLVSENAFREELKFQCRKAKFYGINSDKNIGIFLFTAFILGKNFDSTFPIFAFLGDPGLNENAKCASLENFTKLITSTLTIK